MNIKVYVSMNLVGCQRRDTTEVPDDADEEEIEGLVREWVYEQIEWGWEMMRYPLALDEHEDTFDRLGDHLTEDEMRARFAEIDRRAVLAKWVPEPPIIRGEYPWQTFLGIVGLVVMVLGIAAVLFGMRQAHGAESLPSLSVVDMPACREAFSKLPALAERLGVNPAPSNVTLEVAMRMCDGTQYDLYALINAALDRVDRAVKRSE